LLSHSQTKAQREKHARLDQWRGIRFECFFEHSHGHVPLAVVSQLERAPEEVLGHRLRVILRVGNGWREGLLPNSCDALRLASLHARFVARSALMDAHPCPERSTQLRGKFRIRAQLVE
jgi:hypothetical protein